MMQLQQLLKTSRLPVSIAMIETLNRTVTAPGSTAETLVSAAAADPELTRKILHAANTQRDGPRFRTTEDAITAAGADELLALMAAGDIARLFQELNIGWKPAGQIWNENTFAAVAASIIAGHISLPPGRLYACGLLRGIGHLLIFASVPRLAVKIFEGVRRGMGRLHEIERDLLGFDHAELAAELLRQWHLPETVYEPIRHSIDPRLTRTYYLESAVLLLADYARHIRFALPHIPLDSTLLMSVTGREDRDFITQCLPRIDRQYRLMTGD